jgi:long-chain fatty acid transport protein
MKFSLNKMLLCLGLASCISLTTTDAHAILASIKSTGMAATAVAYPQDAEAAAFNPAGITDVGDRFDVGFAAARDSRKTRVSGNIVPVGVNGKFDSNHHCKWAFNGDFGITKVIGCDGNLTAGLVVYNRNYNKVKYKNAQRLFGTSQCGMEYVHETISPTIAYKLWDRHNFGVSVNWMIQRLWVQGLQNFANPLFSVHPTHVTNHKYQYSQGCSFTFGYRFQVTDCLSIGVTAQPKTYMSKFKKYSGFLAQGGRLHIPPKFAAGIAWRFLPNATVAFDVEWINWKRVKSLHRPLQENLIANKLGSEHGTGFGFPDQWFYRVGIDYEFSNCLTFRAGYRHVNGLVRRSQTAVNALLVDTVKDFVTVGATYCLNANNEISVLYAHGFRDKVKGRNSIPASFGGGEVDLKQYTDVFGISWGHTY